MPVAQASSAIVSDVNISDPRHPQFTFEGTRYEMALVTNGDIKQIYTVQASGEKIFVGSVLPGNAIIPLHTETMNNADVAKGIAQATEALKEYDRQHPQLERQNNITGYRAPSASVPDAAREHEIALPQFTNTTGTIFNEYVTTGKNGPTHVHEVQRSPNGDTVISDIDVRDGQVIKVAAKTHMGGSSIGDRPVRDQAILDGIGTRVAETVLTDPKIKSTLPLTASIASGSPGSVSSSPSGGGYQGGAGVSSSSSVNSDTQIHNISIASTLVVSDQKTPHGKASKASEAETQVFDNNSSISAWHSSENKDDAGYNVFRINGAPGKDNVFVFDKGSVAGAAYIADKQKFTVIDIEGAPGQKTTIDLTAALSSPKHENFAIGGYPMKNFSTVALRIDNFELQLHNGQTLKIGDHLIPVNTTEQLSPRASPLMWQSLVSALSAVGEKSLGEHNGSTVVRETHGKITQEASPHGISIAKYEAPDGKPYEFTVIVGDVRQVKSGGHLVGTVLGNDVFVPADRSPQTSIKNPDASVSPEVKAAIDAIKDYNNLRSTAPASNLEQTQQSAPPPIPASANGRRPLNGVLQSAPVQEQAPPPRADNQVVMPAGTESPSLQFFHHNWRGGIVATRIGDQVTGLDVKEREQRELGPVTYRNIIATVDSKGGAHVTDLLVRTPHQPVVSLHLETGADGKEKVYDSAQHVVIGSDGRPHKERTEITDPVLLKQDAPFIDAAKAEAKLALDETKKGASAAPAADKPKAPLLPRP